MNERNFGVDALDVLFPSFGSVVSEVDWQAQRILLRIKAK